MIGFLCLVVDCTAKVQNFKQITTYNDTLHIHGKLLLKAKPSKKSKYKQVLMTDLG